MPDSIVVDKNLVLGHTPSSGIVRRAQNLSGSTVVEGAVVVLDTNTANSDILYSFKTTTTRDDSNVMGIVLNGTVEDKEIAEIMVEGFTDKLLVDGTTDIAAGDLLGTFTTAGISAKAVASKGVFAKALEAYTANDSNGQIKAIILGSMSKRQGDDVLGVVASGGVSGLIDASDYAALPAVTLQTSGGLNLDGLSAGSGVFSSGTAQVGPQQGTDGARETIECEFNYGEGRPGAYFQIDLGADIDLSAYGVLKVVWRRVIDDSGGTLTGSDYGGPENLEFRLASAADGATGIADTTNVHTRWKVGKAIPDTYHETYITLNTELGSNNITARYLGFYFVDDLKGGDTATCGIRIDLIEKPAMPKWWNAVVSNPGKTIVINPDYTDAQADPVYVKVPEGTYVLDLRNGFKDPSTRVDHAGGTSTQWFMDSTLTIDVQYAQMQLWENLQDGDTMYSPEDGLFLCSGDIDSGASDRNNAWFALGPWGQHNITWYPRNSLFWMKSNIREADFFVVGGGSRNFAAIGPLRLNGYRERVIDPASANEMPFVVDKGTMTRSGAGVVMKAQGDVVSGPIRMWNARTPGTDGRQMHEMTFQWSGNGTAGDRTDDIYLYVGTVPIQTLTNDVNSVETAGGSTTVHTDTVRSSGDGKDDFNDRGVVDGSTLRLYRGGVEVATGTIASHTASTITLSAPLSGGETFTIGDVVYVGTNSYFGQALSDRVDKLQWSLGTLWWRNLTTGAVGKVRQVNNSTVGTNHNLNIGLTTSNSAGYTGGDRAYFEKDDSIELFEMAETEIYNSAGTLVTDAHGFPERILTVPATPETWTIRWHTPGRYWWYVRPYFHKLKNVSNDITIAAMTGKNIVDYDATYALAAGLKLEECTGARIDGLGEYALQIDGFGGDAISCNGNSNWDNVVRNFRSWGNRRQGVSTTDSRQMKFEFGQIVAAGRNAMDVEPQGNSFTRGYVFKDIVIAGQETSNVPFTRAGQWFVANGSAANYNWVLENIRGLAPCPTMNDAGTVDVGSSEAADFDLPAGVYQNIFLDSDKQINFDGSNQIFNNFTCRRFRFRGNANGNVVNGLNILPPQQSAIAANEIGPFYEDDAETGGDNVVNGLNFLGTQTTAPDIDTFMHLIDVMDAVRPVINNINWGPWARFFPAYANIKNYGTVLGKEQNLADTSQTNVKSVSASSRRGRNFVSKAPYTLTSNILDFKFPLPGYTPIKPPVPLAENQDDTKEYLDGQGTLGSGGGGTNYYYFVFQGTPESGMYGVAPYTAGVETVVTPTFDSVRLGFKQGTAAFTRHNNVIANKQYVFRGTVAGVATHRFDVEPPETSISDLGRIQVESIRHIDLGSYLKYLALADYTYLNTNEDIEWILSGSGTNEYYARLISTGGDPNLTERRALYDDFTLVPKSKNGTIPLTAINNTVQNNPGTLFTNPSGNYIVNGVKVGHLLTNVQDGSTGTVTGVTATTISCTALSGGTQNDFDVGETITITSQVGNLGVGEWVYDDNDTLGYDTYYVRLADGTDPDSSVMMSSLSRPGEAAGITAAQTGTVTLTANTHDAAGSSTTVFEDADADFIANGVEPGFLLTLNTGGTGTIQSVNKTKLTLDAALTAADTFEIGDTITVTREWGQGGYQLVAGVPTYAADQFNDETYWEPDANYIVDKVVVKRPAGVAFNYARWEADTARWGGEIRFYNEDGTLATAPTGAGVKVYIGITGVSE